jgi:hypothetical protein
MLADKLIDIAYIGQDAEDEVSSITVEYSLTGAFAGEEFTATPKATDDNHDGISGLAFTAAGASLNFVWDASADLGYSFIGNVHIKIVPNDGTEDGLAEIDSKFISFLPANSDEEGVLVNVSASDVGVRVKHPKKNKYFRYQAKPLEPFKCPEYVINNPGIIKMINDGVLVVSRHAENDDVTIKDKELNRYVAFGTFTLDAAATSKTVSDADIMATTKIMLSAATASAASLTGVYIDAFDVIEGQFTITHDNSAGTEIFNWVGIGKV